MPSLHLLYFYDLLFSNGHLHIVPGRCVGPAILLFVIINNDFLYCNVDGACPYVQDEETCNSHELLTQYCVHCLLDTDCNHAVQGVQHVDATLLTTMIATVHISPAKRACLVVHFNKYFSE